MNFVPFPDIISFSGNRILIRKAFEEIHYKKKKSTKQQTNETNLKENTPAGVINRKIRLRMRTILDNWLPSLNFSPTQANGHKKEQATFVTLTLPSEQMHTDKVLNAKALNNFITQIKRSHQVKNYLWRAERQKNGNLHYHIIIDKFISHRLIRNYWNIQMKALGYISIYQSNMISHHSNGFKVRNDLKKKWSIENQKKAYDYGTNTNWKDPNSTDIHSLKNIKNISSYVCKYVTKDEDYDDLQKAIKANNCGKISSSELLEAQEKFKAKIESKKVNSRLWGCSDEIRNLKDPATLCDIQTDKFVTAAKLEKGTKTITDEFFTVIYVKNLQTLTQANPYIKKLINDHRRDTYEKLYLPPKPKEKSPLRYESYYSETPCLSNDQLSIFDF